MPWGNPERRSRRSIALSLRSAENATFVGITSHTLDFMTFRLSGLGKIVPLFCAMRILVPSSVTE